MNCPISALKMLDVQNDTAGASKQNTANLSNNESAKTFANYLQKEQESQKNAKNSTEAKEVNELNDSDASDKNDLINNSNSSVKIMDDVEDSNSDKINDQVKEDLDVKHVELLATSGNLEQISSENQKNKIGTKVSIESDTINTKKMVKKDKTGREDSLLLDKKSLLEKSSNTEHLATIEAEDSLLLEIQEKLSNTSESKKTKNVDKDTKILNSANEQLAVLGDRDSSIMTAKTLNSAESLVASAQSFNGENKFTKDSRKVDSMINVIDERTASINFPNTASDEIVTSVKTDDNGNAQMTMNFTANNSFQATSAQIVTDSATPNTFSQMLDEQLQNNTKEFVKAGTIALKDNNQGTINLILHPDDLGNVKINLEISDNILKGKIVVATKEAYNAFQDNLANFKQAFTANGFDSASFNVTWSGSGAEHSFGGGQKNSQNEKNLFGHYYEDVLAENDSEDSLEISSSYNNIDRKYIDITA